MIAIIGAGLTGLSTAWHLGRRRRHVIFEQHDAAGGLCRSPRVDGFTFDYTGHLLHLRDSYTLKLAERLLAGRLRKIERNAAVFANGRYLPFPFQANLHGLPRDVLLECLEGFVRAHERRRRIRRGASFHDWVLAAFGPGMARHFFLPYNEKLFCRSLRRITPDWTSWSVPRPSLQDVLRGALGMVTTGLGYNASFWYPEAGGIQVLPDALAARARRIETDRRLVSVRLRERRLVFADGSEQPYDTMVATLPLARLLRMLDRVPERFAAAPRRLTASVVHNINIGINRAAASPYHWIYFPGPEFPFYRVGCYSNFTPAMAPRHTSSLYVEIAARRAAATDYRVLREAALEGLRRCGLLRRGDRIVAEQYNRIDPAYVVFDRFRQEHLAGLLAWLKRQGVIAAGRYGSWTYCAMEDNILQGRAIAEALG